MVDVDCKGHKEAFCGVIEMFYILCIYVLIKLILKWTQTKSKKSCRRLGEIFAVIFLVLYPEYSRTFTTQ